jgi:hypothetical protein
MALRATASRPSKAVLDETTAAGRPFQQAFDDLF